MVKRRYWLEHIEKLWQRRRLVWLSGVRRVGKTCRAQSLPAIECKWSAANFDATNLRAFANQYPKATAVVVAHDVAQRFTRREGAIALTFVSLEQLLAMLTGS